MKYLLLLFLIYVNICNFNCELCEKFKFTDDKEIINKLKSFSEQEIENNFKNCIDTFIQKGKFSSLEFFLNQLLKYGIKFKDYLNTAINNYTNLLHELKNKFKFKETDYQRVAPAIRWAQNNEYIFLEIKFSHRHDAPGKNI